MTAFETLTAAVQVGVHRSAPPLSGVLPELAGKPERVALIEAGTLDLMRKAGTLGIGEIAAIDPPADEHLRVASASAIPLSQALELGLTDLVLEWARRATNLRRIAPPSTLIRLIKLKKPELTSVLGERGAWLARMMGIEIVEPELPPSRETLKAEWGQLDWKDRAQGIEALETDLSAADEELLARGVSDKRKEVREASARLLARLEGSAWSREIQRLGKGRIALVRKLLSKTFTVQPPYPEEIPKSIPQTSSLLDAGPRALALYDLVRWTNPAIWEREIGLPPADILRLAAKNEYGEILIRGWHSAAAEVFLDQNWIDALFMHLAEGSQLAHAIDLFPLVSNQTFEKIVREHLKAFPWIVTEMARRGKPFSPELSRVIVDQARKQSVYSWRDLAAYLDESVLSLLSSPWDDYPENIRQHWHTVLDLRKRLFESLQS